METWTGTLRVPCSEEARHWVDSGDVEALAVEIAEVFRGQHFLEAAVGRPGQ
jgi:hypothetical protein